MAADDLTRQSEAFRSGYRSALNDVRQDANGMRTHNGTITDLVREIDRRLDALFLSASEPTPATLSAREAYALSHQRDPDAEDMKEDAIADGLLLAAAAARSRASGESDAVQQALLIFAAWCEREAHRYERST